MNEQTPSVVAAPVLRPMLPGTGSLLKATWSDYAHRFWTYVGISIIPIILIVLVTALGVGGAIIGQGVSDSAYLVGGGVLLGIVAFIVALVIYLWSQLALIYAITHSEQNAGIKESFSQTWGKIGSYLWIGILSGFIIMCGMMLFAIPGIVFAIWFLFPLYIFLTEGDKGFTSLLKSREYVRDYWFPIFGRLLLMMLIIFAIFLAFVIIGVILALTGGENSGASIAMQILQQILQLLIYPFIYIFYGKIYMALRTIKGQVVLGAEAQKDKQLITIITVLGFLAPLVLMILLIAVPLLSR